MQYQVLWDEWDIESIQNGRTNEWNKRTYLQKLWVRNDELYTYSTYSEVYYIFAIR